MTVLNLRVTCIAAILISFNVIGTTTALLNVDLRLYRQYATTPSSRTTSTTKIVLHEASSKSLTSTESNSNSKDDAAAALTHFMAQAHEEKITAMARVEEKFKLEITDLKEKISELETQNKKTTPTSGNSFAFPATNQDLTKKIQAYRTFISEYIVKSQEEKKNAIDAAESTLIAKYEAIIDDLKGRK
mgnify:CR=1 FL=1